MGGTQDNGAWWGPSQNRNSWGVYAADWNYLPTGDAYFVLRDWWNPDYMYYESQFGASSRINLATGEISPLAKRTTPEESAKGMPAQRYQWNAPIVLSPHNPGIVYVCSQFVHRSLSRGEPGTFVTISPDLSRADKTRLDESKKTNLQYATIYSFAESAKKPGLYWAGTDDGNVQLSTDCGVTWTNITANFYDLKTGKAKPGVKGALIPFDRWVKRVVPSRYDENTCYVAFNGYRTHNEDKTWIFVTHDLGKTWEDLSGGLMNPVWDLEEDPDNANVLYAGTDYGVWITIDKGKTWTAFSTSAPNVIIRDVAVQKRDRDLVIGTYGRGIYIADIAPLKEMSADVLAKDAYLVRSGRGRALEPARAAGRTVRRVRQGRQPAHRLDHLLLSQGRAQGGQGRGQGPRGQPHPGDHRHRQEGPPEGLLEPDQAGRRVGPSRPLRGPAGAAVVRTWWTTVSTR